MVSGCGTVAVPTRRAVILGLAPPPTRREELAVFLRTLRERTAPESVGLPVDESARRRTPGLRREELSALAGVGLSWYTWLEQGRDITPSPAVLDALARVLDLSSAERAHLFDLAGVAVPPAAEPVQTEAPPELAAWVAGLDPWPAYLINPRTDVLAANAGAHRVIGLAQTRSGDAGENLLRWLFRDPGPVGYEMSRTAQQTLARFRSAHARRYDDPSFRALIEEMLAASPRFRELWPRHEVLDAGVGTKRVDHPELGELSLLHLQSIPTSHPELRLTQLIPADDATRARLAVS